MQKKTLPSLSLTFAGVEFRSPFAVGPMTYIATHNVTPEEHAEVLLKQIEEGAGYIYMPSASFTTEETERKLKEWARPEAIPEGTGARRSAIRSMRIGTPVAPFGVEAWYSLGHHLHSFKEDKERLRYRVKFTEILVKRKPQDVPLIANIKGLSDLPDTYVDAAKKWEELGAELLQINLSDPAALQMAHAVDYYFESHLPARNMGSILGDNPDAVEKITREVVKAVGIPVGVKLTPETGFPRVVEITRRIRDAGARFVNVVGATVGIAPPDIFNRGRPLWAFANSNPWCHVSGPWLRHIVYKDVAAIAKFVPGIEIAASGGLVTPQQCIEVMMLGAGLTSTVTGALLRSTKLIEESCEFLKKFMVEQGYQKVEDIIGLGQQYISYREEADSMPDKVIAQIDQAKCNGCGLCLHTMCCVIIYPDNGSVKINAERCTGCGRCMFVCPQDAIKLALKT